MQFSHNKKGRCYKIFITTLWQQGQRRHCKLPDGAAALIGETSMGDEEPVKQKDKRISLKRSDKKKRKRTNDMGKQFTYNFLQTLDFF